MKTSIMKFLSIFLTLISLASARVLEARLSSHILAQGEVQQFQILVPAQLSDPTPPPPPTTQGIQIQPINVSFAFTPQGPVTILNYQISSYNVGTHTIPAFSFQIGQDTCTTTPQTIRVFPPEDMKWSRSNAGDDGFPYCAQIFPLKTKLYEGETTPVEIKIYFPNSLRCGQWSLPKVEKTQADLWEWNINSSTGNATLLGNAYSVVTFTSTLQSNQNGKISLGPGSITTNALIRTNDNGYYQPKITPITFEIHPSEINCQTLPPNPPQGFHNAIGQFSLEAHTTQTEVRDGDPIQITLTLTGQGNLAAIPAPQPENPNLWKIYQPSSQQANSQNTNSNIRQFTQTIRSNGKTPTEIPAFELPYFNPSLGTYQIAKSQPIPIRVLPSLNPSHNSQPPTTATTTTTTPITNTPAPNQEAMTDILGPIPNTSNQPNTSSIFKTKLLKQSLIHGVFSIISLLLLTRAILLAHRRHQQKNAPALTRQKQLKQLNKKNFSSELDFLRAAASFAEQHQLPTSDPELQAILEMRDQHAYRPQPAPQPTISRTKILQTLRRLCLISLTTLLFSRTAHAENPTSPTDPALAAYQQQNFSRAAQLWLNSAPYPQLPANTLYNIGTAAYRDNQPGLAALYFQRSLTKNPHHPEAKQNLRFLSQKLGTFQIPQSPTQQFLTNLPLPTWLTLAQLGTWLFLIGILSFFAFSRPQKTLRLTLILSGLLILLPSLTACLLYPKLPQYAPTSQQQITLEPSPLFTNASLGSSSVAKIPAGSTCILLKQTESWKYITLGSTRGWLPASRAEALIPNTQPHYPQTNPH